MRARLSPRYHAWKQERCARSGGVSHPSERGAIASLPAVQSRPSRGRPPSISEALPSPILRRLASPEVLLLSPCGSPLAQTRTALPALQGLPGWDVIPAIRQGHVYAVDGQTYFHRPGPRIVDSLETLAGLLHPDLFGEFLPPEGELYCRITT